MAGDVRRVAGLMARRTIPHLAVPFDVDGRGHAVVVDQDSEAELTQAVRVTVATRRGERLVVPQFGVPEFAFTSEDPSESVTEAIREWDSRVTETRVERVLGEDPGRWAVDVRFDA